MDTERPHISEKVKFWEEQDRINMELIPRVLKQHELFTSHIESHEDSNMIIGAMEARVTSNIQEVHHRWMENSKMIISDMEAGVTTRIQETRRRYMLVSGTSLCISIIAVIAAVSF